MGLKLKLLSRNEFDRILEDVLKCIKVGKEDNVRVYLCKVELPKSEFNTEYVVEVKEDKAVVSSHYVPEQLITRRPQDLINIHYILINWFKELNKEVKERGFSRVSIERLWDRFKEEMERQKIPVEYSKRLLLGIADKPKLYIIHEVLYNKRIPPEEYPKIMKELRV